MKQYTTCALCPSAMKNPKSLDRAEWRCTKTLIEENRGYHVRDWKPLKFKRDFCPPVPSWCPRKEAKK